MGDVSEMGDAVLGMLVSKESGKRAELGSCAKRFQIRKIKAVGTIQDQEAKLATQIYKGFGRWSSVCSAIVCWALIAA